MVTELKIDLGEEEVRSLVAEGILASLTDKKREELIRAAIAFLLDDTVERRTRDGSYKQEKVSRFQIIWERQAERELEDVIHGELQKSEELQNKFRELFNQAMDKFFTNEERVDRVTSTMADAFSRMFKIENY